MTRPLHSAERSYSRRVNGLPHEIPSIGSILTLRVHKGFLFLVEKYRDTQETLEKTYYVIFCVEVEWVNKVFYRQWERI